MCPRERAVTCIRAADVRSPGIPHRTRPGQGLHGVVGAEYGFYTCKGLLEKNKHTKNWGLQGLRYTLSGFYKKKSPNPCSKQPTQLDSSSEAFDGQTE